MIEEYLTVPNLLLVAFLSVGFYIGFHKIRKLLNQGFLVSEGSTPEGADAERFAKLLALEIKMYGESKLESGLANNTVYDSLRDEIEKARKTFTRKFMNSSQMTQFEDALVAVLADGDPSKMGEVYPRHSN